MARRPRPIGIIINGFDLHCWADSLLIAQKFIKNCREEDALKTLETVTNQLVEKAKKTSVYDNKEDLKKKPCE